MRETIQHTVVIIDGSGSMLTEDYHPSRLDAAVEATRALIEERSSSSDDGMIGIVLYDAMARTLQPLAPISSHREVMLAQLNQARAGSTTAIGEGLHEAMQSVSPGFDLDEMGFMARVRRMIGDLAGPEPVAPTIAALPNSQFVVLSDGHQNSGRDPLPVADAAKRAGVRIDTVGIGGSPLDVDEGLLKKIASLDDNGRPRYRFIGDGTEGLVREFKRLGGDIRPL